jgi:hypothetical protein
MKKKIDGQRMPEGKIPGHHQKNPHEEENVGNKIGDK